MFTRYFLLFALQCNVIASRPCFAENPKRGGTVFKSSLFSVC